MTKNLVLSGVLALLVAPVATSAAFAQTAARTWEGYSGKDGTLEIRTSDGRYLIKPYSANIVETTFIPKGETAQAPVFATSHAVVMAPEPVKTVVKESADALEYATPGIAVTVSKSPFRISYSYKGKPLLAENNGYAKKDGVEVLDFRIDGNEALFGGGARALGMDRRGNRLRLYNKAHYGYETRSELMNYTMPLVLSSKIYAVHFDNPAIGWLDLDSQKKNVLAYETIGGRKTYQVIAGDSWEGLVGDYTKLTGRQPLPPRWTFGNFASRFGYHSETEARGIIDKFHAEKIPVDAIVFDLYWFGPEIKGSVGNLAWSTDRFPTPQKMMADFAAKGVKTVLITEPFILTTSNRWNEAVRENILATGKDEPIGGKPHTYDFYFGHTGLIDIFGKKGRDWFWNVYRDFTKQGVSGWWGDLGEPEVHPSELRHATGTADDVHNIYGHEWAKLVFEGYAKDFPDQRPFILMRSGYSGSQRFGLIPWTGDVNRSWGGLQSQPEIALAMGMQGIGYMHSDLGGFANPNLDDELYARWLQYGVFQPVFRPHAQEEVPSEPVLRAEKPKALAKAAIELRYRLLPYNYTLAFDNNRTGTPLMRPMMFEEPGNAALRTVTDTYLWGRDFLVAPILHQGQKERKVYFPATAHWFDFHSGAKHAGGSTATLPVAAEHIPVFVRAGAFIPMAELVQTTRDYSTKKFNLHYYHDASVARSDGKLYDDDGETPNAYEQGKYALLRFGSKYEAGKLNIALDAETGRGYAATDRNIALKIHNMQARPKAALVDGTPAVFNWNEKDKTLSLNVNWKAGSSKRITFNL